MRRAARRAREGEGALRRAETRAPARTRRPSRRRATRCSRSLGLAVAFHDAGSWTRVVARKNVPDPVSETHEPHEHMHEPHSPGTWLLRERLRGRSTPRARSASSRIWSGRRTSRARQARAADRRGLLRRHGDGAHGLPLRQELDPAELEGLPHGRDDRVRLPRPRRQAPARGDPPSRPRYVRFRVFLLFDRVRLDGVVARRWREAGAHVASMRARRASARVRPPPRERARA